MALASHVHCIMLTNEGKQQAAGDEIGLKEENWCYVR